MTLALAVAGGLCYFIGTCRVGSGTYHSLGSGVFIGFICGLVYGDVTTGLLIGASINLVYLGVVAPAGQIPSDEIMASAVAIPLALAGGLTTEMAVTLAVPFGLLGVFWIRSAAHPISIGFIRRISMPRKEMSVGSICAAHGILLRLPL